MVKCTICGEDATFKIKGTSEYYCDSCAEEHFSDVKLLQSVEETAKELKKILKEEHE